jgi:hypothetical protein
MRSRLLGTMAAVLFVGAGLWGCGSPEVSPAEPVAPSTAIQQVEVRSAALAKPIESRRAPVPQPAVSRPATQAELDADQSLPKAPEAGSCLQLKEECQAGQNTCAVRCCDDWLYLFYNTPCDGSCTADADFACAGGFGDGYHGGPKRIRWQP